MDFSNLLPMGNALAGLALALTIVYFFSMMLLMKLGETRTSAVVRYEPPASASPGVAAWLLERGDLSRAMASSLVNMAAKSYVKIEQDGDLYSVTRLGPDVSLELSPEEDALARTLFKSYDCFDFDMSTPQFSEALGALRSALLDTTYFSRHILLSAPAWAVSGAGAFLALLQGNLVGRIEESRSDPVLIVLLSLLAVCVAYLIFQIHSLPDTVEKIRSRFPESVAPKRAWSGSDSAIFIAGIGGMALLTLVSTFLAALFTACFFAVNVIFFYALQGLTAEGKEILAQVNEYKSFLAGAAADRISRMSKCTSTPAKFTAEHAYAIAFHLDLGWGEQFVGAIAQLI